jgi:hypothetical protein
MVIFIAKIISFYHYIPILGNLFANNNPIENFINFPEEIIGDLWLEEVKILPIFLKITMKRNDSVLMNRGLIHDKNFFIKSLHAYKNKSKLFSLVYKSLDKKKQLVKI